MREDAVKLAARGFRVFPLLPGRKIPPQDSTWTTSASAQPLDAFERWTRDDGAEAPYNIGVLTTGLVVLDVDVKGRFDGRAELQNLQLELGALPSTFTVETPSGGLHIYFDAGGERISQRPIAPGIDIRAANGYVVGPGSVLDGKGYRVAVDAPLAALPLRLAERLRLAAPAAAIEPGRVLGGIDDPLAVERARAAALDAPAAVEGERNNSAYKLAARLYDFGVSRATCRELLDEWNGQNDPPLEDAELDHVANSAGLYRQETVGRDNPLAGLDVVPPPPNAFSLSVRTWNRTHDDDSAIPPRPWLASRRMLRGKITLLVAPGSIGKSLLTLQWAAALAIGEGGWCGLDVRERTNVLVVNNEDEDDEINRRLAAVFDHFGLDRSAAHGRIHIAGGPTSPFIAVRKAGKHGAITETETVAQMIEHCRANNIGAIVVDPLIEMQEGLAENDNGEASRMMRCFRRVALECNAAVVLVHHTKKPNAASADSYAGDAGAGRGASAFVNAARIGLTAFSMSEKDAEQFGVDPARKHRFVRLDDAKANLFLASPEADWFERRTVRLPNGEDAGVLAPVALKDKAAEVDQNLIDAVAQFAESDRTALKTIARRLADKCPLYFGHDESQLAEKIAKALRSDARSFDTTVSFSRGFVFVSRK